MKCIQCVIWFFVISVCIALSVIDFGAEWKYFSELEFMDRAQLFVPIVSIILLAVMHVPLVGRSARVVICAVVGISLLLIGNWIAGIAMILHGGITHCTRGDEAGDVGEEDGDISETLSAAFPVNFTKASIRGSDMGHVRHYPEISGGGLLR